MRFLPLVPFSLCFLVAACGQPESDQDAADEAVESVSQLTQDRLAIVALEGGWYSASTEALWTFKPEGYLTITEASSGYNWAILRFARDDTTIEVIDVSSPPVAGENAMCAHENKGTFGYTIEGDELTLTRVDDPCEVRGGRLDGLQLDRIETPVQPGLE